MSTDINYAGEAKTSSDENAAACNHPPEQREVERQSGDGKSFHSDVDDGGKSDGQQMLRDDTVAVDLSSVQAPEPDDLAAPLSRNSSTSRAPESCGDGASQQMLRDDTASVDASCDQKPKSDDLAAHAQKEVDPSSPRASSAPALVLLAQSWVGREAGSRLLQRVCAFVARRRECCSVTVLSSGAVVIPKMYYDDTTTVAAARELITSKLGEPSFFLFAGTDRTTVLDCSSEQPIKQYLTEKTGWCLSIDVRLMSDLETLKTMARGKWCKRFGWSRAKRLSSAKGVSGNEFITKLHLSRQALKGTPPVVVAHKISKAVTE